MTVETARLTADVVLFAPCNGELRVLLIRRSKEPFEGCWALPGGRVDPGEDTEDAAHRELQEEARITLGRLALVGAYATPGRDPRGRYVTFAYTTALPEPCALTVGDDATDAYWWSVDGLVPEGLAFDHFQIITDALRIGGGR